MIQLSKIRAELRRIDVDVPGVPRCARFGAASPLSLSVVECTHWSHDSSADIRRHNPFGVGFLLVPVPRVGPQGQPWARGHNAVGVGAMQRAEARPTSSHAEAM